MDTKQYTRKPFPVSAVQVTLQNIEKVTEWCKGTIEYRPTKMLGTTTDLPVIKLKGQDNNSGRVRDTEATLGCYIVELRGSFRVYKPIQFEATFDEMDPPVWDEEVQNRKPILAVVDELPKEDHAKLKDIALPELAAEIYTAGENQ